MLCHGAKEAPRGGICTPQRQYISFLIPFLENGSVLFSPGPKMCGAPMKEAIRRKDAIEGIRRMALVAGKYSPGGAELSGTVSRAREGSGLFSSGHDVDERYPMCVRNTRRGAGELEGADPSS